uniref:Uncharacterized protein n=1 Tax=Tetranychus urticae TaxID=32264 RepID=T1KJB7_TETUR
MEFKKDEFTEPGRQSNGGQVTL